MIRPFCPSCALIVLSLVCCGIPRWSLAAPTDLELVEALEAADERRDRQGALGALLERMHGSPPLASELGGRVLRDVVADEELALYYVDRVLAALDPAHRESPRTLIVLAEGLAGDGIFPMPGRADNSLSLLLEAQRRGSLPATAFEALLAALDNRAVSNREIAIRALGATPAGDERYDRSVAAITAALENNKHWSTRLSAAAELGAIGAMGTLPAETVSALKTTATSDPWMTVRIEALEALSEQALGSAGHDALARTLVAELIEPDAERWQRSRGTREHQTVKSRAERLLDAWYDYPFPEFVVDGFIALSTEQDANRSRAILAGLRTDGALTSMQRERLLRHAAAHSDPRIREAIYALLAEVQHDEDVEVALESLMQRDENALHATYGLLAYYASRPMPQRVANTAADALLADVDPELRAAAARLLVRGPADSEQRERTLADAARRLNEQAFAIEPALVELQGDAGLEGLVARYAADTSLHPSFRSLLIRRLATTDASSDPLDPTTIAALERAGRDADDYWLLASIASVYESRALSLPFGVFVKQKDTHYRLLGIAWIGSAVVGSGTGLLALLRMAFAASNRRLRGRRLGVAIAVWLMLTLTLLASAGLGVIGSLGHNYSPPPAQILSFNVPFYVATLVFVIFAFVLFRITRAGPSPAVATGAA